MVSSLPFVCHICSKGVRTRSELRQHVFTHVRDDIQSKYYPDNVIIKNCLECNYKSTEQHVLMHLALKHQKIIEFVPQEVSELFYPNGSTTTTATSRKNSTENNELAVVDGVGVNTVSKYFPPKKCNFFGKQYYRAINMDWIYSKQWPRKF